MKVDSSALGRRSGDVVLLLYHDFTKLSIDSRGARRIARASGRLLSHRASIERMNVMAKSTNIAL